MGRAASKRVPLECHTNRRATWTSPPHSLKDSERSLGGHLGPPGLHIAVYDGERCGVEPRTLLRSLKTRLFSSWRWGRCSSKASVRRSNALAIALCTQKKSVCTVCSGYLEEYCRMHIYIAFPYMLKKETYKESVQFQLLTSMKLSSQPWFRTF